MFSNEIEFAKAMLDGQVFEDSDNDIYYWNFENKQFEIKNFNNEDVDQLTDLLRMYDVVTLRDNTIDFSNLKEFALHLITEGDLYRDGISYFFGTPNFEFTKPFAWIRQTKINDSGLDSKKCLLTKESDLTNFVKAI